MSVIFFCPTTTNVPLNRVLVIDRTFKDNLYECAANQTEKKNQTKKEAIAIDNIAFSELE